jgi:hypothetical protein
LADAAVPSEVSARPRSLAESALAAKRCAASAALTWYCATAWPCSRPLTTPMERSIAGREEATPLAR